MRLFLYGSLRDPAALAARSGDPRLRTGWQPAALLGWRVVAVRGSCYPTLVRGSGTAAGIMATVGARGLAALQRYEGAAYRLSRVTIDAAGRKLPAYAWIARGGASPRLAACVRGQTARLI